MGSRIIFWLSSLDLLLVHLCCLLHTAEIVTLRMKPAWLSKWSECIVLHIVFRQNPGWLDAISQYFQILVVSLEAHNTLWACVYLYIGILLWNIYVKPRIWLMREVCFWMGTINGATRIWYSPRSSMSSSRQDSMFSNERTDRNPIAPDFRLTIAVDRRCLETTSLLCGLCAWLGLSA